MTTNTRKLEVIEEALLDSVSGGADLTATAVKWCISCISCLQCLQCIFQDDVAVKQVAPVKAQLTTR